MTFDCILGVVLLFAALAALCLLVWWSLVTINHIAHKDLKSVRDIVKGLKDVR